MSQVRLFVYSLLGFSAFTLLTGCAGVSPVAPLSPTSHAIQGVVHGGQQPVTGATIQLYDVGTTGDGSAATPLLTSSVKTDASGNFSISGKYTCTGGDAVYLVATGGNSGSGTNPNLAMMTALNYCGNLTSTTFIFVNEVTTVGSIAALYTPYMTSYSSLGSGPSDYPALLGALAHVPIYTDTTTGSAPGPSLPGGMYASSTEINTLSNIVASCVNSTGGVAGDLSPCGNLFNLTKSGGVAPTNTIAALLNILNNPTQNAASLFSLPQPIAPFQPSLASAPTTWSLPILTMAATPSISVASGTYSSAQFVTLSDTTSGAVIHYTTDGSTPTSSSPTYTGTITVSSNETLNAIAQTSGYGPSAVASATYTISGSTATYTVSGQINIPNCGVSSIPTMTVTLTSGSTLVQTTTTNGSGNFTFSGVPLGTYTVTPSISGPSSIFSPTSQSMTITSSSTNFAGFSANLGYTVSGTVTYGGAQTGQTYLLLNSTCGGGNSSLGTSISSAGAYTIRGVPPGNYTVQAWMDPLGQGVQNAIDPSGAITSLAVTNGNVTGATVAMQDPTFATPTSNPAIQNIIPNAQGALVLFQSSTNSSNLEDANQYELQWSTSPALGGGGGGGQFASVAGSQTFTPNGDKGLWVVNNPSLQSGQTYYFQARSFNTLNSNSHPAGWCNYTSSGCSGTTFTAVNIAPPACTGTCTTVTGSVTIPPAITIKAGAPLYLGLLQFSNGGNGDPSGFYLTEIANPSNGANGFTVTVPSGSNYAVMGILDQNNTGGMGAGSITNIRDKVAANLTISGSTQNVGGITLPTSNSTATVSTQFSSNSCLSSCGSPSTGYQLNFEVNGADKLPVAVTLNSGPNVLNNNGIVAVDMGICTDCGNSQFGYSVSLSGTPNVGDTYGFTVTYSDGSHDTGTTVTGAVTGWNGGSTVTGASDAPTALLPNDNSSSSTQPTFTWTDSANAMGANFYYTFGLSNSTCSGSCTSIWHIPGNNSKSNGFSSSITAIPWITSGNDVTGASGNLPTVSALNLSSTIYNWYVQVQDSTGNSAQTQVQYQP